MTNIITMDWQDDSKRVLIATYHQDGWTWDDMYGVLKQQKEMIDTVDHTVDVIVDVRKSSWLPRGGTLTTGVRKLSEQHPRQGHTIIVGAKGMIAVIVNTVMKMIGKYRAAFHFTNTMEEAQKVIAELQQYRSEKQTPVGKAS